MYPYSTPSGQIFDGYLNSWVKLPSLELRLIEDALGFMDHLKCLVKDGLLVGDLVPKLLEMTKGKLIKYFCF